MKKKYLPLMLCLSLLVQEQIYGMNSTIGKICITALVIGTVSIGVWKSYDSAIVAMAFHNPINFLSSYCSKPTEGLLDEDNIPKISTTNISSHNIPQSIIDTIHSNDIDKFKMLISTVPLELHVQEDLLGILTINKHLFNFLHELLESNQKPNINANIPCAYGKTPLILAAKYKNLPAVQLLIKHGAHITVQGTLTETNCNNNSFTDSTTDTKYYGLAKKKSHDTITEYLRFAATIQEAKDTLHGEK